MLGSRIRGWLHDIREARGHARLSVAKTFFFVFLAISSKCWTIGLKVKEPCDDFLVLLEENVEGDRELHPFRFYDGFHDYEDIDVTCTERRMELVTTHVLENAASLPAAALYVKVLQESSVLRKASQVLTFYVS